MSALLHNSLRVAARRGLIVWEIVVAVGSYDSHTDSLRKLLFEKDHWSQTSRGEG